MVGSLQGTYAGDFVPQGAERAEDWLLRLLGGLKRVAQHLDRHTWVCCVFMAALLVPLVLIEAHSHPLMNDEIYTLHIAQAPSLRAMVALAKQIDLHPPLHYVAERYAMKIPGPRWLCARLPSLLAVMVVMFSLFRFAAKRLGNVFGLVAVAMFWLGSSVDYAWSNRPYILWLAWLSLLLLANEIAVRPKRPRWALPLVFGLGFLMVMTHLLGVWCLMPFLVAEIVRWRERKRIDVALGLMYVLPMLCAVGGYYQMHHLSENSFPIFREASLGMAGDLYGGLLGLPLLMLAGSTLVCILLFGNREEKAERGTRYGVLQFPESTTAPRGLRRDEWWLLGGLLLMPMATLLLARFDHLQFWTRYGVAAMPASAVMMAALMSRRMPMARVVAVMLMASTTGYMVYRMAAESAMWSNVGVVAGGRAPIPLTSLNASLPIVAASPMTFVEMSNREPAMVADRVYYLTDRQAALQYAHYTLFENEDKICRLLNLPSKTEPLAPFLAQHKQFYVVGRYDTPEVWLLRKLAADGFVLDYLGKYASTYESRDLYLVSH
jgi:hypothetical protein